MQKDTTREDKISKLFDIATNLRHIVDNLRKDNQFDPEDVKVLEDAVAYINTADMDERAKKNHTKD